MSASTRTARAVPSRKGRPDAPVWNGFLTMPGADFVNDLSRLHGAFTECPISLELRAHDGLLLLGRLQHMGRDASVPALVREAIEDVLAIEFPTLVNFEARILESLDLLDTLDLRPTFTDIMLPWDGFDPTQLLGDDFLLSLECTLAVWVSVSDQLRRPNDNHPIYSDACVSAGTQDARRHRLGNTRFRAEDPQLDGLRSNLLHLRPLLDRLGLAIQPSRGLRVADKLVNHPRQADLPSVDDPTGQPKGHTSPTTENAATELTQTTREMIHKVGRAYHASIVRDQPASVQKILTEAATFLSVPELKLLHKELLAVQLACRLEEYIRETP